MIRGQDAGTYNFLEDVDLVEEHSLLVLVHVRLAQHLNSSLSTAVSVDAEADLTEGTLTEHLTDSVEVAELALSLADELSCVNLDTYYRVTEI